MPLLTIRTNLLAGDTVVEGALIPGAGGSEAFDENAWIRRLQDSSRLLGLLTDDAHGSGSSTLVLVDSSGSDVPQGFAGTFLSYALDDLPGMFALRSDDRDLAYVARTKTPGALDSDPVWQLYRYQASTGIVLFADGNANFDNRWSDRELATYL